LYASLKFNNFVDELTIANARRLCNEPNPFSAWSRLQQNKFCGLLITI